MREETTSRRRAWQSRAMQLVDWIVDRVDVAGVVTFLAGAATLKLLQLASQGGSRLRRRLWERGEWYDRLAKLLDDSGS